MGHSQEDILRVANSVKKRNYHYIYMKAMLKRGRVLEKNNLSLVTGSSYALNGIDINVFKNAVNCSMYSQDLYYDFLCARGVLDEADASKYKNCFIISGYYGAYNDVSLGTKVREWLIPKVYYPIFHDAHNWEEPYEVDIWARYTITVLSDKEKKDCIEMILDSMRDSNYYTEWVRRSPFYDFSGKRWEELSERERERYGKERAEGHNRIFQRKACFIENKEIFRDYMHYLELKDVKPIVIVPPLTKHYNRYINKDMKAGFEELVNSYDKKVEYVDFNEVYPRTFNRTHFTDMDHLNEKGAVKFSKILMEM